MNRKLTYVVKWQIRIHKDERENRIHEDEREGKDKPKVIIGRQRSVNTIKNDLQNKIGFDSESVWNTEEKKGCAMKETTLLYLRPFETEQKN